MTQLPSNGCLIGDIGGEDALELRQQLAFRGTAPSFAATRPANTRGRSIWKKTAISSSACSAIAKTFRRIATRYDKLARNFASAIALAAAIVWWTH